MLARCNGAEAFDERLKPERIASWEAVEGAGGRHPSDAVEDPWQAHAAIRELLALGSSETNPLKVAERRRRAPGGISTEPSATSRRGMSTRQFLAVTEDLRGGGAGSCWAGLLLLAIRVFEDLRTSGCRGRDPAEGQISDPPGAVVRRSLRLTGAMELPGNAAR